MVGGYQIIDCLKNFGEIDVNYETKQGYTGNSKDIYDILKDNKKIVILENVAGAMTSGGQKVNLIRFNIPAVMLQKVETTDTQIALPNTIAYDSVVRLSESYAIKVSIAMETILQSGAASVVVELLEY